MVEIGWRAGTDFTDQRASSLSPGQFLHRSPACLPTPGLEVRRLFDFVRDDVMEATGRKQKPFSYGSISGRQDFYFVAGK